ncbi:unnamed protein product [Calypogeia fissa]
MKRDGCVQGFALLALMSMATIASATESPIPAGFKVVNNDALNNRVKNGDIIRYVFVEDNYEFALVFLNTGPPSSYVPAGSTFYLSLITKPGGDPSLWNTVWSANRNKPVKENATLALESNGNLVLTDSDGTQVWSTNLPSSAAIAAATLDLTGNLQLLNKANKTVWQTFDYPDDSLLPGQYVKSGKSLVAAIATISYNGTDYATGKYSMKAYPGGLVLTNGTTIYYYQSAETQQNTLHNVMYTCLHPNDEYFDISLGLVIKPDLTKTSSKRDSSICGKGDQNVAVVIGVPTPVAGVFTSQFVRIDPDGVLRLYQYSIDSRAYKVVGSVGDPLHPMH